MPSREHKVYEKTLIELNMSRRSRAVTPTTHFSKSFLASAWAKRNELQDFERRGFAQFLYLTVCGHIESVLAAVISARLRVINRLIRWENFPPFAWKDGETDKCTSLDPVFQSVTRMADKLHDEVASSSLSKLIEIFGRVFPDSLRDVLGGALYDELDAIAALRNVFAHGRDLTMEFESSPDFSSFKGVLEGNPLRKPALRLHQAGIITDFEIDGINYSDFLATFYSDEAMRHFYTAVENIEERLQKFSTFEPERMFNGRSPLPPLGA